MDKSVSKGHYYEKHLAAERLRRCYEVAPPRVQRYLAAEVDFVVKWLRPGDVVLDLGCGYGRTMPVFGGASRVVIGADSSLPSLLAAQGLLAAPLAQHVVCTDAARLAFRPGCFDRVVCIQNGISAFHVEAVCLLSEVIRLLRPDGVALFSTYSERFWKHRMDWFERQAAAGLIGEIDREQTGNGTIICKDGFTATTETEDSFRALTADLDVALDCIEVDESSLFFVVTV